MRHADELSMTMAPAAASRGATSRDAAAPENEGQIDAGEVGGGGIFDVDLASGPRQPSARRPGRGEEAHLVDGKGPLDEQARG